MSDTGNAQLLAHLHSNVLRYNHTQKEWFVWNDQYWLRDRKMKRYHYAKDVSKYRQKSAIGIKDNNEKKYLFNFGVHSGDKSKIESMLAVATTLPVIATSSDNWDRDDLLVQCRNGVLALTNGKLIQGKPDFMISQSSRVHFDSSADCPIFDQFLLQLPLYQLFSLSHLLHLLTK